MEVGLILTAYIATLYALERCAPGSYVSSTSQVLQAVLRMRPTLPKIAAA